MGRGSTDPRRGSTLSGPAEVRTERVRAFVAWLNTVEHPHWEQPGFSDFADLTQEERTDAGRILHLQADAHFNHADKLEAEVSRRIDERTET